MIAHRLQRLDEVIDFAPEADDRASAIGGLPIDIRCLRKAFGANEVLRGIDLHVRSGQFVALVMGHDRGI
jgi:sulfonate transport system ATP-binding protein